MKLGVWHFYSHVIFPTSPEPTFFFFFFFGLGFSLTLIFQLSLNGILLLKKSLSIFPPSLCDNSSEGTKKITILLLTCKVRNVTYKWIMKVLPLERHTYFIINVIHNTYPHIVFIFTHDYPRFLLISPSPYFHKQIKHSPLTYKAQKRMYKRCSQLTLQHTLSPWVEGIIFTKNAGNPGISRRYTGQCSNSSVCLLLVTKRQLLHFGPETVSSV